MNRTRGRPRMLTMLSGLAVMALVSADPLACQPNDEQPMLPIFHVSEMAPLAVHISADYYPMPCLDAAI